MGILGHCLSRYVIGMTNLLYHVGEYIVFAVNMIAVVVIVW